MTRLPKPIQAQRSRARFLAYKRRPQEEIIDHKRDYDRSCLLAEAMILMSPEALTDYLEWKENHEEAS